MRWLIEYRCKGHDGKISILGQHEEEADTEDKAREAFHIEQSGAQYEIISIDPSDTES